MKYLLKIGLFATLANIVLAPLASSAAALFAYAAIICFLLYSIIPVLYSKHINLNAALLIAAAVISFITSVWFINGKEILKKSIAIFSFVAFYLTLSLPKDNCPQNNITFKYVTLISILMFIRFAVYLIPGIKGAYSPVGEYGQEIFTMGLSNPNGTAVYVLFVSMVFLLNYKKAPDFAGRIIWLLLIACLTYILIRLRSRTVLFCFTAAVLCTLLPYAMKAEGNARRLRIIRSVVLAVPVLMIGLQLILSKVIGAYTILGKALDTGRANIYADLIKIILKSPMQYIFGNLCGYAFYNFHNGIITEIASIGFVGCILVMRFWVGKLKSIEQSISNEYELLAYYFVLLFIVESVAESMTVIGAIPYSLFVYVIVKIAQGDIAVAEAANELPRTGMQPLKGS